MSGEDETPALAVAITTITTAFVAVASFSFHKLRLGPPKKCHPHRDVWGEWSKSTKLCSAFSDRDIARLTVRSRSTMRRILKGQHLR
eukprot:817846-Lingulodinium_polyedra.AAC.1